MIINIPDAEAFKASAVKSLIHAFRMVKNVWDTEAVFVEEDSDYGESDVWAYHSQDLNTAIVLIHQGIELYLKHEVCKHSPLLLIAKDRDKWPTFPGSKDVDFDDLYTISGDELLRTVLAVDDQLGEEENIQFINEVRKKRNKILHGHGQDGVNYIEVIDLVLSTFTIFMGQDAWWSSMVENYVRHPSYGSFEGEKEKVLLIKDFSFVETAMHGRNFNQHFSLDLKKRKYYCPWCAEALLSFEEDIDHMHAVLTDKDALFCIVCGNKTAVSRRDCPEVECKGDVIGELYGDGIDYCLTCSHESEE